MGDSRKFCKVYYSDKNFCSEKWEKAVFDVSNFKNYERIRRCLLLRYIMIYILRDLNKKKVYPSIGYQIE